MTEMRKPVRRLLWRWGSVMERCAAMQREIEGFQEMAQAARDLPPVRVTGVPGNKNPGDPTGRMALRAAELADRYDSIITRLIADCDKELAFKDAMDALINQLLSEQQRILDLRYKQGWNWNYIAFKMCFSPQHVRRIETAAVEKLADNVKVERL